MRFTLLLLPAYLLLSSLLLAQVPFSMKVGYERNLDLVKFTKTADVFSDQGFDVRSSTQKIELFCTIPLAHSKWNLGTGVAYKMIKHEVKDYVLYTPYSDGNINGPYYTKLTTNALSTSRSLGIKLEVSRIIHQREKFNGSTGLNTEWYFLEFYNSRFINPASPENEFQAKPKMVDTPKNFFFSSCNLSVFYRFELQHPDVGPSLALKLSLGTNLYSDWDQFSKYVWIGVGGELGIPFRKKRADTPTSTNTGSISE